MISERTKVGLAAAKARGVKLGNAEIATANRDAALNRAEHLRPIFAELAEIESSSRLYEEDGALYLSMPLVTRPERNPPRTEQQTHGPAATESFLEDRWQVG